MTKNSLIQDFLNDLQGRVKGDLRTDTYSRMFYSTDASIYQVMPYGVLIPQNVEDVHAAVECAVKYNVPILPRTSGTSLAGQTVNEALVIDMNRNLNNILEVNTEEKWVRVQPGIVLDELNIHLRPMGLQFGPDPASSNRAAMGGIVSNNSTGSHSIVYGMTTDHVLEMDVFLSDGTATHFMPLSGEQLAHYQGRSGLEGKLYRDIAALATDNADAIRAGTPRHWRRCGGYNLDRFIDGGATFRYNDKNGGFNLSKLVSGGEGTLAVMTEIKLNLVDVPKMTALAIVHFGGLFEALSAIPVMLEVDPSAIELMDNIGLTACREVPQYARLLKTFVEGEPNCILITEFYGESDAELRAKVDRLITHLKNQSVNASVVPVIDKAHQADVWTVRKAGQGFLMSTKGDHKPIAFIEDAAVPPEHLAEYVIKIEEFCHSIGTNVAYYAHASAGCVHIHPLVSTKTAKEIAKMPEIMEFSVDLLRGYSGSLSSEHGDGRARSWINERFFGPDLYKLYQRVKATFDPENILNPGNIVNAPPMTETLRYGDNYEVIPLKPHLDFSYEHGFDRAIEMCDGTGVCKKRTTGTMCPSYMVTREEEHSTRGRANALRAAMSGVIPVTEFTSPRMYQVMDLCIGCKACKAECPVTVDMGKIKVEFLAQYYEVHGTPVRTRMFGNIATLSRLSSGWLAPLANLGLKNPLMRKLMQHVMGISEKRTLPNFARQPFTAWFKKHKSATKNNTHTPKKQVVLFNDTFNTYNYPHVAIAATEVLEAAGFEVILPGHKCCGRPMISKGLVEQAKAAARDTVDRLAPYAKQGIPIVGLEPSCLLSLRDEYHYLIPDHPDVKIVAEHAIMFEEFIAQLAEAGELDLTFTEEKRDLLLHGHCHQKALVGTNPSKKTLTLPTNYAVSEVDSGCCGMAGSFGYEAEHYAVSLQMGERRLLPAVREASGETIVVAAGVSCRQQIKHGTGKQALHPAEVLRDAIKRG